MNKCFRWRLGAVASAIALTGSFASIDAQAFALGRITVQSALGEPLRAEIDIAEITADEAGSLRAGVASADAFRTAGLEYSPAVIGLQITLQKKPDGRSFLRLSSTRAVLEPFIDLVLDASWSSGRVVRDYTMLFDPPTLRQAPPTAPTAPILSRPDAPSGAGISSIPYSPPPPTAAIPLPPRQQPVAKAPTQPAPPRLASSGQRVAVKQGDTAGKIATQNKPASISLDQMLAALLRSNPDAFIGGNVNRLKSGTLLYIPGADQAGSIPPAEASRMIVAQSRDFNDFRRKLAEGVPTTQLSNANREAKGKVQAKVEDRASETTAPDKLTLSKGAVQGKAAAEEKIAKDRQAKEASDRVAQLTKNISDLSKITGPATAASTAKTPGIVIPAPVAMPAPITSSKASAPAGTASATANPTPVTRAPLAASSSPASVANTSAVSAASGTTVVTDAANTAVIASGAASTPASGAASAPTATPVKKPAAVAPPPLNEPGLMDTLTENPLLLGGIAALLVLLASLGIYHQRRKRKNALQVDSSFLESRLQPDSFFGASGGHRIDTNEGGGTGSSLVYSPSQLDATGDVDPIAEADVYLAYGRDLQAEEILKEAMRTNPARVSIYAKLLEIYAKRRDAKAFEVLAIEAFKLTKGAGLDWAYIGEMGRQLDAENSLYKPGGQPVSPVTISTPSDQFQAASAAFASSTLPQLPELENNAAEFAPGIDLDLDFSLAQQPDAFTPPVAIAPSYPPQPSVARPMPKDPDYDASSIDFPVDTTTPNPTYAGGLSKRALPALKSNVPLPDANGLDFTAEPVPATGKLVAAAAHSGPLEFDLSSLSLELSSPVTEGAALSYAASEKTSVDPLETKFSLAEEFRALGDADGARSLAEEVVAQASGSLKIRAQTFINGLS